MSAAGALTTASRWAERQADVCRRHPNVIGVWESPDARTYAVLLTDTLVPLRHETPTWLKRTRATAQAVIRELRASGLRGVRFIVLQWRGVDLVAEVLDAWACRYDADPTRREQHARFVATELADRRFLSSRWRGNVTPVTLRLDLSKPIV